INNAIKSINEIKHSIVIANSKTSGEKYLVCYYISNEDMNIKKIRNYLKLKLPMYMIPNYFQRIEEIPLSVNGKLDRKALPEPDMNDYSEEDFVKAETQTEKEISAIFSEIFNISINEVGKMTDFYEIGGDSLYAIRLISKINKTYQIKLNINDILNHPILCDLSKLVEIHLLENRSGENQNIIKRHDTKEFPVTSQQLGVYIDSIKNPESIVYNITYSFKIKKNIDIEKIKEGFLQIFNEHEILKSRYYEKEIDGKFEIYGYIDDDCKLEFEEYDSIEDAKSFVRPFDLSKAPLIRVGFVNEEVLLIDIHHMVSDGTTNLIIISELNKFYRDGSIEKLDVQFKDYAIDIKEKKDNGCYDEEIEFYKNMFDGDYDLLNIPKKIQTVDKMNDEGDESISQSMGNCNKSLSYLWICVIKIWSSKKIYSSVITANRNNYNIENMIGMFVGTQPIILNYESTEDSFMKTIKKNMNTLMDVYDHQNLSFSELINELKLKKVDNAFVFNKMTVKNTIKNDLFLESDSSDIYSIYGHLNKYHKLNNSKFDISLTVFENEKDYLISIDYNSNIYDSFIINSILESYIEVLGNLDQFHGKMEDVEYIPSPEKSRIINEFNQNSYPYEESKFYHEEFNKIAKKYPDKNAIVFNGQNITFKMLDEMSNSVAHFLREIGIQRNEVVPLICDRSFYYIVGFIGVMKSGAAYLTIDPEFPRERIEYMMNEVNAKIFMKYIIDGDLENTMKFGHIKGYSLDKLDYTKNKSSVSNINQENDICYVLFTSGTTGKPKGTLTYHNNLLNYCMYSQKVNGKKDIYGEDFDNVLAFSKFTFDMSIVEIHYPLLRGSRV
ncbi:hypothetical protein PIROE2DRAFT_15888, partial [Piromyces sp. E2]